jgi:4-carboxymuconolactone decarboxylase
MNDATSLLDPVERTARGLATQAEVTGAPAPQPFTLLDESWRDFIYAEVWTRPGLDRRSRYLISMASTASSNGPTEALDSFVRGALINKELTLAELREAALHLAVYSGWPKGGELDKAVTRIADELGLPAAITPPIRAEEWDPRVRTEQGMAEFNNVMTFGGPPPVTPYFDAGINNFVFGEMWSRPGLDQRSRRWITLVGVSDSCAHVPIHSHVHAAMASGNCQPEEMQEFVLQYAIHAGWPKASVVQGAVIEMTKKFAAGLPWNG